MSKPLPLCGPPGYDYETTGPWWIVHVLDGGHAQAWTMWTFESAVTRFWLAQEVPPRRVMIDAMGVTVLATEALDADRRRMVGTRQTMDQTLDMVRRSPDAQIESEAEVLRMVEVVRSLDGQAL